MSPLFGIALLAVVIVFGPCFTFADTWYVDIKNTSGIEDGLSWTTSFNTIQEGVDAAFADGGGEVWVASGTYMGESASVVTLAPNVSLYGGFAGVTALTPETALDSRDIAENPTIIDGQNARRCVTGAEGALLDGFILRNGAADTGAGLYLDGITMTVRRCVMENCIADSNGGGVYHVNGVSAIFDSCHFLSNIAGASGGAMEIRDNASAQLVNCVFADNEAPTGAGLANATGGSYTAMNCVFYGNTASSMGGGIYDLASGAITNSILWANAPEQILHAVTTVTYCDVQGGEAGIGNINADPKFWDAAAGDFHLAVDSPCIDAGISNGAPAEDNEGTARPIDIPNIGVSLTFDMGVYEMPNVVFVDIDTPMPNHLQDGRSWGTAYDTIQEGVDRAFADGGGEVWIAEGTYRGVGGNAGGSDNVVVMKDGVSIYGGFASGESSRNEYEFNSHNVIIDGEELRRCLYGSRFCTIEGITITNGNSNNGDGIYNYNVSPLISNCKFLSNKRIGPEPSGGALWNDSSSPKIVNCLFDGNGNPDSTSSLSRGAIVNVLSYIYISKCTFSNNSSYIGGAIANLSQSSAFIEKSLFFRNKASFGGAIRNDSNFLILSDCRFSENSGGHGGAIDNSDNLEIENCLFFNNSCIGTRGGAILNNLQGAVNISNCIFWRNNTNSSFTGSAVYSFSTQVVILNSIIWNNISGGSNLMQIDGSLISVSNSDIQNSYIGVQNIESDPSFVDAANGNFRLKFGSPCIDTGTMDGAPWTDLDNNPRPVDIPNMGSDGWGAVDMGAYEKQRYIWHVDKDNTSGVEDGASWDTAYTTIQPAIDAASADGGGEVWVADGIYDELRYSDPFSDGVNTGSVIMRENVRVYGGFSGVETLKDERDPTLYKAI